MFGEGGHFRVELQLSASIYLWMLFLKRIMWFHCLSRQKGKTLKWHLLVTGWQHCINSAQQTSIFDLSASYSVTSPVCYQSPRNDSGSGIYIFVLNSEQKMLKWHI